MSAHQYVAQWTVLDDGLTLHDLVAEAIGDLARMMTRHGARSVGIAHWWASEHAGVPFLNVTVPAEPMEAAR